MCLGVNCTCISKLSDTCDICILEYDHTLSFKGWSPMCLGVDNLYISKLSNINGYSVACGFITSIVYFIIIRICIGSGSEGVHIFSYFKGKAPHYIMLWLLLFVDMHEIFISYSMNHHIDYIKILHEVFFYRAMSSLLVFS